jgi:hypothetical protein
MGSISQNLKLSKKPSKIRSIIFQANKALKSSLKNKRPVGRAKFNRCLIIITEDLPQIGETGKLMMQLKKQQFCDALRQFGVQIISVLMVLAAVGSSPVFAEKECQPVDKKRIKIEGYISKSFRKQRKQVFKEFGEIGSSRVALRVYPMGETSKVIAVGRCVPAYIAQHIIRKSLEYSTGVESLVQQQFVHTHWVGIGVTMFDELSQQMVTADQVKQLLKQDISDEDFHLLYRKLSVPNELVPFFGLQRPNIKIATPN